jgi:hypothetical protein
LIFSLNKLASVNAQRMSFDSNRSTSQLAKAKSVPNRKVTRFREIIVNNQKAN